MTNRDVTVLLTHYNTKLEYMKEAVISASKTGCKILIADDHSEDRLFERMVSMVKELGVEAKIVRLRENRGICSNIINGLNNIDTEYAIRLDSDDVIHGIPTEFNDVDMIVRKRSVTSFDEWVKEKRGLQYTGIIVRTSILKVVYSDHKEFRALDHTLHEDIYHMLRTFKLFPNLVIERNNNLKYVYKQDRGIMHRNKVLKRKERLKLMLELTKDLDVYVENK